MWRNISTAFTLYTVRSWTREDLAEWSDLLTTRGVYVDDDCTRSQTECLIDLVYRTTHISTKDVRKEVEDENVDEFLQEH